MNHHHHRRGKGPRHGMFFGRGPGVPGFGPGPGGPGGFEPGFGPPFGPGMRGGRRHGGRRGRGPGRAGRGDVRAAVLLLLAEEPMHGYQLIKEIERRSEGHWRPSPGAIYPALNLLQDEGLVELSTSGGRRLAALTEAGRAYVTEHGEELGDPWADAASRGPAHGAELRTAAGAVIAAVQQVAMTGTAEQAAAAAGVLARAKRDLYLILAGSTPGETPDGGPAGAPGTSPGPDDPQDDPEN